MYGLTAKLFQARQRTLLDIGYCAFTRTTRKILLCDLDKRMLYKLLTSRVVCSCVYLPMCGMCIVHLYICSAGGCIYRWLWWPVLVHVIVHLRVVFCEVRAELRFFYAAMAKLCCKLQLFWRLPRQALNNETSFRCVG